MLTALTVLLAQLSPLSSGWMSPESFHLSVGMMKTAALERLQSDGWKVETGKEKEQCIVHYTDSKSVTLAFQDGRVESIRFEFVDFLPQVKKAFGEQREILAEKFGKPRTPKDSILIYDETNPNVMVVLSTDHNSKFGKQGLGFLVVRYFAPDGSTQ